ncbi:uncharacterized protein PRCAT00001451001 [Priceomyces carsonii]|uniref:uncharacterized protein n=1 Tax=Priceomyces carsonii TaxID=28549 RepID=UPI002ED983A8|nr:unnamed protein product [Priceomyces carsonii]
MHYHDTQGDDVMLSNGINISRDIYRFLRSNEATMTTDIIRRLDKRLDLWNVNWYTIKAKDSRLGCEKADKYEAMDDMYTGNQVAEAKMFFLKYRHTRYYLMD